jgi:hypothetical protein
MSTNGKTIQPPTDPIISPTVHVETICLAWLVFAPRSWYYPMKMGFFSTSCNHTILCSMAH